MIVEIAFCLRDPEARAEDGGDEILRAGFAVAAGDGDDFERKRFSVTRRDLLVGDQRVVDAKERKIRRSFTGPIAVHHRAGGAALDGSVDESVSVEILPAQRHEQIARL